MKSYERLSKPALPKEYATATISDSIRQELRNTKWSNLLFIGPAGTGKTYQLWALHRKWNNKATTPGRHKIHIISECADIDRYRFNYEWLDAWCEFPGTLCIDDIGYRTPGEWNTQAIYAISTFRRQHQLKTIWTTNLSTAEIGNQYTPAIASRLTGGLVIHTGGKDRRQIRSAA